MTWISVALFVFGGGADFGVLAVFQPQPTVGTPATWELNLAGMDPRLWPAV
ncbi:MAG: hypothetical protein HYY04_15265 [Chloroflexi bacterium]|nr:hypothetical protein [Chloroflexota bacterium]